MRAPRPSTLVTLAALAAYLATASRFVLGGDAGEYATLFTHAGVAHPPGYPLYAMWLRAFPWPASASPAWGASIATALLGVAAVAVLARACVAWGASEGAAGLAAAAFAFSPLAWRLATEPEVFLGLALLAATLAWGVATPRLAGAPRAALVGAVAGLSVCHHHTMALTAPLALLGLARAAREARPVRAAVGAAALAFVCGLAPLLWLAHVGATPATLGHWTWGELGDPLAALRHVLRAEYGTGRLAPSAALPEPAANVLELARRLVVDLAGLPLLVCGVAAWALARVGPRRAAVDPRGRALAALALTLALAGPALLARFNLSLSGFRVAVAERFYLLPMVLLALASALALDAVAGRHLRRPRVALVAAALACAAGGARSWGAVREDHGDYVEAWVRHVLEVAPRRAVVLAPGDHRFFGLTYAHEALGLRPDVAIVNPELVVAPWYARRVAAALGLDARVLERGDEAELVAAVARAGRPALLTGPIAPGVARAFALAPLGPATLLLPRGGPPPDAVALARAGQLAREPRPERAPHADSWAGDLAWDYARGRTSVAALLDAAGERDAAREVRAAIRLPRR